MALQGHWEPIVYHVFPGVNSRRTIYWQGSTRGIIKIGDISIESARLRNFGDEPVPENTSVTVFEVVARIR